MPVALVKNEKDAEERSLDKEAVDRVAKLFQCNSHVISWFGTEMQKNPLDLWNYQEIICQNVPDLIIETGTWKGGSALFLASMCDLNRRGVVLTIDNHGPWVGYPKHPRINYLTADSVDTDTVNWVTRFSADFNRVMVILDSDHTQEHVAKELKHYSPLVSMAQYLIVEDTCIHGHPIRLDLPEGPWEAVSDFMKDNKEFSQDPLDQRFFLTCNPGGYLRRIRPAVFHE